MSCWAAGAGPLAGRRVVVTRAADQAGRLSSLLRERGATVVEVPVLDIAPAADAGAALAAAADRVVAGAYEWVVVASPNAVGRIAAALHGRGTGGARVAAVGPGTADAARAAGLPVALVPPRAISESLVEAFPSGAGTAPGTVLLARAAVTRDVLAPGLRAKGWTVDEVEAYRTLPARPPADVCAAASSADAITFTSASSVRNYLDAAGAAALPRTVVCIGPATAEAAVALGVRVDAVADPHTLDGLVNATEQVLAGR